MLVEPYSSRIYDQFLSTCRIWALVNVKLYYAKEKCYED